MTSLPATPTLIAPPRHPLAVPAGWLLLAILGFFAYFPALHGQFIWDDFLLLVDNPLIRTPGGLWQLWFSTTMPDFYPVTWTGFWLEWRVFGTNPLGYHVDNVLLHVLAAGIFWRVLRQLRVPGAYAAAVLFLLHPVCVRSVAWIAERKNTMAMPLYLGTVWCYLHYEATARRRWYFAAVAAFLLAMLSKTSVVTLPLVLLGLAWYQRGRITRQDLLRSLPLFAIAALLALTGMWFQGHNAIGDDVVRSDTPAGRLALAGIGVWFYLGKALWPYPLMMAYPRWELNPQDPMVYLPGMAVIGVAVLLWINRGRWGRSLLLAWGYFVLTLLPVLGFVSIYFMRYSWFADHWQYVSLLGVVAMAVGGTCYVLQRHGVSRQVRMGLLLAVAGIFLWQTYTLAGSFRSVEAQWQDNVAKNPDCFLAHQSLAQLYMEQGRVDAAMPHFHAAVKANPNDAVGHNNLGNAYLRQGLPIAAMNAYDHGLEVLPDHPLLLNSKGKALAMQGSPAAAAELFAKVVALKPDRAEPHFNLAFALQTLGRTAEAREQFELAARLDPTNPKYRHFRDSAQTLPAPRPQ